MCLDDWKETDVGYTVVHLDDIAPAGPAGAVRFVRLPVAGPDGLTMVAVGARPGSYEPRGPF